MLYLIIIFSILLSYFNFIKRQKETDRHKETGTGRDREKVTEKEREIFLFYGNIFRTLIWYGMCTLYSQVEFESQVYKKNSDTFLKQENLKRKKTLESQISIFCDNLFRHTKFAEIEKGKKHVLCGNSYQKNKNNCFSVLFFCNHILAILYLKICLKIYTV